MDEENNEVITNEPTGQEYTVAEIENSARIQKSVTPKYTPDWYIKWIGSIIVLFAVAVRSAGIPELQWIDVVLSWIGAGMWMIVGYLWKDRAVLLLNGVLTIMLTGAVLRELFSGFF